MASRDRVLNMLREDPPNSRRIVLREGTTFDPEAKVPQGPSTEERKAILESAFRAQGSPTAVGRAASSDQHKADLARMKAEAEEAARTVEESPTQETKKGETRGGGAGPTGPTGSTAPTGATAPRPQEARRGSS